MTNLPNLAGIATSDLVEKIGTGKFSASYINWSRTLHLLREHAPGWLPEVVPAADGGLLHPAPVGSYLLIRFRNGEAVTPAVPQAVMDHRNAAIPIDNITARDITDTHRRGICMAAAMIFGLAYELWAKLPLETGYAERDDSAVEGVTAKAKEAAYEEFEVEHLDSLRAAAFDGLEALKKAQAAIPKGEFKTRLWETHSDSLKKAAEKAAREAA